MLGEERCGERDNMFEAVLWIKENTFECVWWRTVWVGGRRGQDCHGKPSRVTADGWDVLGHTVSFEGGFDQKSAFHQ